MPTTEARESPARSAAPDVLALLGRQEMVTHEVLREMLGVEKPRRSQYRTDAEWEKAFQDFQFSYLRGVEELRAILLEEHQVAIRNVRGDGYARVAPPDQTGWAVKTGMEAVRREFGRIEALLVNLRVDQLSDAERRENADALAKNGALRSLVGGRRRQEE